MKKSAGMMPPTLVREEAGQKGDFGPSPSSVMESGTIFGLTIRSLGKPRRRAAAMKVRVARVRV